jgi:hypothetical protein
MKVTSTESPAEEILHPIESSRLGKNGERPLEELQAHYCALGTHPKSVFSERPGGDDPNACEGKTLSARRARVDNEQVEHYG